MDIVTIVSGNVLNKSLNIQKGIDVIADELFETLSCCLEKSSTSDLSLGKPMLINDGLSLLTSEVEDRNSLRVSLKVFLQNGEEHLITDALTIGLNQCSVDYVDTFVISYPSDSSIKLNQLQKTWTLLEENVDQGRVKMIGICDVDSELFIQLYNWARIKPSIVQINLSSCCVVPPELAAFAKANSVQLLTHSDPSEIISGEKVIELMKPLEESLIKSNGEVELTWTIRWILRTQIHLKDRGLLAAKGYAGSFIPNIKYEARVGLKLLNGVFCVHKPIGVPFGRLEDEIRNKLSIGLNAMKVRRPEELIQIERVPLDETTNNNIEDSTTLLMKKYYTPKDDNTPSEVIVSEFQDGNHMIQIIKKMNYADHPLVVGPRYVPADIPIQDISRLGFHTSGLSVIGIGNIGMKKAYYLNKLKWIRKYLVNGLLGISTCTGYIDDRIIDKSTYHKIKRVTLERYLSSQQASHQRNMFIASGVSLTSERAYELACQGQPRPESFSNPLIYSLKCTQFNPPHFQIEMGVVNEYEDFMKGFIHDIGIRLHSNAVCTKLRCIAYGPLSSCNELLMKHVNPSNVISNITQVSHLLDQINLKNRQSIVFNNQTSTSSHNSKLNSKQS